LKIQQNPERIIWVLHLKYAQNQKSNGKILADFNRYFYLYKAPGKVLIPGALHCELWIKTNFDLRAVMICASV